MQISTIINPNINSSNDSDEEKSINDTNIV